MRSIRIGLPVVLAVAFYASCGSLRADEEKVALDQLPSAVVKAVHVRFPEAKLKSAEKENEHGQTVYEVAVNNQGQNIEVTVTTDGTITEIEKQIEPSAIPRVVSAALAKKYPQATYKTIEEVIKVKGGHEKLEYYEVLLVTAKQKRLEVAATPAGKLIKEEDKSKEQD